MSAKRSKPGTGNMAMLSAATSRLSSMVAREDLRTLREVPVAAIRPNPHQPRTYFDDEGLKSLAASIDKMGLIQPVCVQEVALNEFQLIVSGDDSATVANVAAELAAQMRRLPMVANVVSSAALNRRAASWS